MTLPETRPNAAPSGNSVPVQHPREPTPDPANPPAAFPSVSNPTLSTPNVSNPAVAIPAISPPAAAINAAANSIGIPSSEIPSSPARPVPGPAFGPLLRRAAEWTILFVLAACLFRLGLDLRHWAWNHTQSLRFQGDASNAYKWGEDAGQTGLFSMYRQIRADYGADPPRQYGLDYAPLRLTIVTLWAPWVDRHFQPQDQWDPDTSYAFHRPLLLLNALCEAAAALAVMRIVWLAGKNFPGKNRSGKNRSGENFPGENFPAPIDRRVPTVLPSKSAPDDSGGGVQPRPAPREIDPNPHPATGEPNPTESNSPESESKTAESKTAESPPGPTSPSKPLPAPPENLRPRLRRLAPVAAAGLLVWFNPALILNDCWPQWDAWILPFFAVALYCSMCGQSFAWFWAGASLAVGAMLKGQLLFVAPVFFLWPLFSARWLDLSRLTAGFAVAFTLIALPWMITGPLDIALAAAAAIVAVVLLARAGWRRPSIQCAGWRRPFIQFAAAAVFVAAVWLAPIISTGDLSWLILPFIYGSTKHPEIAVPGTSNLPALLHEQWGWDAQTPVHLGNAFGHDFTLPLRALLAALYAVCLVLCGAAAAFQWRRRDPRFLIAIYAPWLLFFALLPYLNSRYLLWAAALFPLLIPLGAGMTLLGALLCLACCAMIADIMARESWSADPSLRTLLQGQYPGAAYALLLIAAIFLYHALTPGPRRTVPSPIPL